MKRLIVFALLCFSLSSAAETVAPTGDTAAQQLYDPTPWTFFAGGPWCGHVWPPGNYRCGAGGWYLFGFGLVDERLLPKS